MKNIRLTSFLISHGAIVVLPGEPFPKGYSSLANSFPRDESGETHIAVPEEKLSNKGFMYIKKLSIEAGNCLAKAFSDQPDVQINDMSGEQEF